MAHYLIRVPDGDSDPDFYFFAEAPNAREAIKKLRDEGQYDFPDGLDLWVLRHGKPRHYTVRTETKTIIEALDEERGE